MAEPKTTGEAIQIIRRALYDMARQPGWSKRGVRQQEILNYCMKQGWPVPVSGFEKAIAQLHESGQVESERPWVVIDERTPAEDLESRYSLTGAGDEAEEEQRRGWGLNVLDEIRKPRTFVELLFALLGFALGLVSGFLLASIGK